MLSTTTSSSAPSQPDVSQPAHGRHGRGTLRRHEHALQPSGDRQVGQQFLVVDRDRRAAGAPDRVEHEEVASALGTLIPKATVCASAQGSDSRAPASKARTIGAHPVDCTDTSRGSVAGDPAQLEQLAQRLVDADQPHAATGGIDDHVGHPPAELLGDLEAHRLLALDAVRLLERGNVEPVARRSPRLPATSRPASEISPSTRRRSAPAATHSAPGDASARRSASRRASAGRHARRRRPRRRRRCRWSAWRGRARRARAARETPTAAPRALNDPVGSSPSSLISRRATPSSAPSRGAGSSGVMPSPRVTTCSGPVDREQLVVAPQVRRAGRDVAGAGASPASRS